MTCPHCGSPLSFIAINTTDGQSQTIDECLNCGGHFLPAYTANFLSLETAKNVDSVLPKSKSVPATHPVCPQCGQSMSSIKDDSVPGNVTVFTCPNGHGDFFPINQLLSFKKAQQAKIYYHKLWGIPLKSAFAVIIPLVIVFTAVAALPTILKQAGTSQENRVKASDILTQPLITPISNTQVLISFSTKNPAKTSLRFTEGLNQTFTVSASPQTTHLLNVDNLTSGTLYKYVIILDINGKITTTDEYTFATP
jgi:Zn-finger nucleic acid-binding protein